MGGWVGVWKDRWMGTELLRVFWNCVFIGWHIFHEIFLGRICAYYFIGRKPVREVEPCWRSEKAPCGFC